MISTQEEDDFIAVRVQDPRIQHEGSWNSYVDYKIFLHTNSKAFTAKTSCVRRRYSEFTWLKKKLQKNAGLVPVPELPCKSLFSFSNEDFLERRRKGLQVFLDKVLHMTVCLSDSQLHLFLQTQLPVGHILDCVQGHTPYTVTDAILTYASSNRGLAQAQEDDLIKEPSMNTVSYESMESPAPHQQLSSPEMLSSDDIELVEDLEEVHDQDIATLQLSHTEKRSLRVLQKNNHLEAVVEYRSPSKATFFLGGSHDDVETESADVAEETQEWSCQIQTPVEVHSPMGMDHEDNWQEESNGEQNIVALDTGTETDPMPLGVPQGEAAQWDSCVEKIPEESVNTETVQKCETFEDKDSEEQVIEQHVRSEEAVLETVFPEEQGLDHHVISEDSSAESHVTDISGPEKPQSSSRQTDKMQSEEREPTNEASPQSAIHEDAHKVHSESEVQHSGEESTQQVDTQLDQMEQEVDFDKTSDKEDNNEDSQSLSSSSGSIIRVSDEESICDETENVIQNANGFIMTSPDEVIHWSEDVSRSVEEQHTNGCLVDQESSCDSYVALEETNELHNKTLECKPAESAGDLIM
ncbi:sorting nexin-11 [Genypterus blacodes]|uniref:sorting nexin-11 n=1 Tax=Genypterus blacodes TaxID=154954 RepID=UPI003F76A919